MKSLLTFIDCYEAWTDGNLQGQEIAFKVKHLFFFFYILYFTDKGTYFLSQKYTFTLTIECLLQILTYALYNFLYYECKVHYYTWDITFQGIHGYQ